MCVWQKARVRKEEGVIKYERGTKVEGTCSIKKFKNIIARKNDILFIFIIPSVRYLHVTLTVFTLFAFSGSLFDAYLTPI